MKIRNTSKISTEELKPLIRFCLHGIKHKRGLKTLQIKHSNRVASSGLYFSNGRIMVKIQNNPIIYPFTWKYPNHKKCRIYEIIIKDWKEAFIHTLTHELNHHIQYSKGKKPREDQCEKKAYLTIMKYRNNGGDK